MRLTALRLYNPGCETARLRNFGHEHRHSANPARIDAVYNMTETDVRQQGPFLAKANRHLRLNFIDGYGVAGCIPTTGRYSAHPLPRAAAKGQESAGRRARLIGRERSPHAATRNNGVAVLVAGQGAGRRGGIALATGCPAGNAVPLERIAKNPARSGVRVFPEPRKGLLPMVKNRSPKALNSHAPAGRHFTTGLEKTCPVDAMSTPTKLRGRGMGPAIRDQMNTGASQGRSFLLSLVVTGDILLPFLIRGDCPISLTP